MRGGIPDTQDNLDILDLSKEFFLWTDASAEHFFSNSSYQSPLSILFQNIKHQQPTYSLALLIASSSF